MIGDNYDKDIVGAQNLNIDSYWINERKLIIPNDSKNTTMINSFSEILSFI